MTRQLAVSLVVGGLAGAILLALQAASVAGDSISLERVEKGLEIAPVPLNLTGKDRALVGLGSYIVNAQSGCSDCHTCPSSSSTTASLSGGLSLVNTNNYLAGGRHIGSAISKNITPDASGRPAGYSLEEFKEVLRKGRSPRTGLELEVMPWPMYHNMNDLDIKAIYEYLRAIPRAVPGVCDPSPSPTK